MRIKLGVYSVVSIKRVETEHIFIRQAFERSLSARPGDFQRE